MATDIENFAGGYFIEVLLAIMLYGIAITQAYVYWWDYSDDSRRSRWTVVILMIMETLHTGFSFAAMYEYLIINFNDIEQLQTLVWYLKSMQILIAAIVQGFLIQRIWICHHSLISSVFKLGSWQLYRDTNVSHYRPFDQAGPDVRFAGNCHYLYTITFLATLNARQHWRSRRRYRMNDIVSMELSPRVTSAQAQGTQAPQIEILTTVSKVTDNMLHREHGGPKPLVSRVVTDDNIESSKIKILNDDY
ncbi:hypothetical protein POSPLADRAFT_1142945 [Postia placenta MAD-698-R-SB12]|uniref:Uncharacterized protein n=1 Tax=Postia placenta MAD-698-R-SB12 TaxID=670580 RepID=A0A1X6N184_9APHY|nr:hypothetical protein POSPLADRAFT_1142945 [Postia placenta MAD-698-R-SB12]OSX62389.1 hypothetical protein POSPLADRAFT_1142945 [Postia placenta MAD-698-R-SB12]